MKRIMILNGAARKNGNTAALLKAFTEGAESAGNTVQEFYLQDMNIHGCMGCEGCSRAKKGVPSPCVQSDDMLLPWKMEEKKFIIKLKRIELSREHLAVMQGVFDIPKLFSKNQKISCCKT